MSRRLPAGAVNASGPRTGRWAAPRPTTARTDRRPSPTWGRRMRRRCRTPAAATLAYRHEVPLDGAGLAVRSRNQLRATRALTWVSRVVNDFDTTTNSVVCGIDAVQRAERSAAPSMLATKWQRGPAADASASASTASSGPRWSRRCRCARRREWHGRCARAMPAAHRLGQRTTRAALEHAVMGAFAIARPASSRAARSAVCRAGRSLAGVHVRRRRTGRSICVRQTLLPGQRGRASSAWPSSRWRQKSI
jgi:hypothetical protein